MSTTRATVQLEASVDAKGRFAANPRVLADVLRYAADLAAISAIPTLTSVGRCLLRSTSGRSTPSRPTSAGSWPCRYRPRVVRRASPPSASHPWNGWYPPSSSLSSIVIERFAAGANVARDYAEAEGKDVIDISTRDKDVALSPRGEEQAKALGTQLNMAACAGPEVIWCSSYIRAQPTARIAADTAGIANITIADFPGAIRRNAPLASQGGSI